ncbi:MAG: riboflavin synthase [Actinobacteria bacterium]|nr:riboflavin synthase [Actinomycetota bacterium]
MFTGIVEGKGTIRSISKGASVHTLETEASFAIELSAGESVSLNGVCLTVTGVGAGVFAADVSPETFRVTTIGKLKRGDAVNLERALAFGERLGGHLVSGHVDGVGEVLHRQPKKNALFLIVHAPPEVARYVVERGSIAVDGVSLTAFNVSSSTFTVSIIPHTASRTALGEKKKGDPVNLEADLIAKYVEKLLGSKEVEGREGLTIDMLKRYGYA